MSEWKPIETAPKDGTAVLAYQPVGAMNWVVAPMYWPAHGQEWLLVAYHEMNTEFSMHPTHWMELPEPPK